MARSEAVNSAELASLRMCVRNKKKLFLQQTAGREETRMGGRIDRAARDQFVSAVR